ncbi:AAA family ATPase [Thermomicrobium sp. CFH 73360]|uniref:sigma 54-interacting transcriptional regulator n=1 Tax=Thermomicrobium sp. CFH 73360 TaxID=2951987 RepID=UPI002076E709|nr:sigma 54-interacting transcriptional regulator [Thermomicrobium sp. CFH 73360]MCM8746555.1 AAA family ATPase [Thermomicrobium sp. CFH 73360]
MDKPRTLGELRESGYRVLPVREEMRKNLIAKIQTGEPIFEGIIGYEETVIPQVENAILAGQDIIFLGERGQAKTRMARLLVNLLDEEIPIVAGSEVNDNPFAPISKYARDLIAKMGDETPIVWIGREDRYAEKLATPDTTIADLIGEIDPIKVAEGRYLSDELTIHYGLIPRTNRGIFVINELPDLAERIQVGLLNIMEERDVQIRGYRVRLPLDVFVVASANPEDYTNRGRIITPLKDRFGAQIRTHYPRTIEHEIEIMEQERTPVEVPGITVTVPQYMREIVAEITHLARRSPDISQRSGVSARMSVANYETLVSNAVKRAIRLGEKHAVPRISDLPALIASTLGKLEFETLGEVQEERIIEKLINGAVAATFNRYFSVRDFDDLLLAFENGLTVEASDLQPAMRYVHQVSHIESLRRAAQRLGATGDPALVAAAVEFVLEGLHLNRRLNKDRAAGRGPARYRS